MLLKLLFDLLPNTSVLTYIFCIYIYIHTYVFWRLPTIKRFSDIYVLTELEFIFIRIYIYSYVRTGIWTRKRTLLLIYVYICKYNVRENQTETLLGSKTLNEILSVVVRQYINYPFIMACSWAVISPRLINFCT